MARSPPSIARPSSIRNHRGLPSAVARSSTTKRTTTARSQNSILRSGSIPTYATAYSDRGYAYYRKGDLDQALNDVNEAFKHGSIAASTYNHRALVLHAKREYDEAIADLTEAIRLDPELFAYPSAIVVAPITQKRSSTGRSWTSTNQSGSIRQIPSPIGTGRSVTRTNARGTGHSPIGARRCSSILAIRMRSRRFAAWSRRRPHRGRGRPALHSSSAMPITSTAAVWRIRSTTPAISLMSCARSVSR